MQGEAGCHEREESEVTLDAGGEHDLLVYNGWRDDLCTEQVFFNDDVDKARGDIYGKVAY